MHDEDLTREEVREEYESRDPPTDGHRNFGDVNPGPHGGIWATYDNGEWTVYETAMSVEVGFPDADDEDTGDQYVTAGSVQMRDLVTDNGEWTDHAKTWLGTFQKAPDTPMGAVADGRLTAFAAWYATEHNSRPFPRRENGRHQEGNYAAVLDACGIDPEEDDD
jgi:hypothetical protein